MVKIKIYEFANEIQKEFFKRDMGEGHFEFDGWEVEDAVRIFDESENMPAVVSYRCYSAGVEHAPAEIQCSEFKLTNLETFVNPHYLISYEVVYEK